MKAFSIRLEDDVVAELDAYIASEKKRTGLILTRSGLIASFTKSGVRNRSSAGRLPRDPDEPWRSANMDMSQRDARMSFDHDVTSLPDRRYADAIVIVCDSADFATRSLIRNGIEPTAEAVAMMACRIAEMQTAATIREEERD